MSWSWCPTREFVIVHLVSVLIVSISVTRYSTAMYKVGWAGGEEEQGGGGLRQVGDDEVVDGGGGGGGDVKSCRVR